MHLSGIITSYMGLDALYGLEALRYGKIDNGDVMAIMAEPVLNCKDALSILYWRSKPQNRKIKEKGRESECIIPARAG